MLSVGCGSCNSKNIKCTDSKEIIYNHIVEISYECMSCGHKGAFIVDCIKRNELQINIK